MKVPPQNDKSAQPMRGETLDALFDGALELFQSRTGYRFSLDALLLAHFASFKHRDRVIDLGTGCGVIALILARSHPEISILGVEHQSALAGRAARNVTVNRFQSRVAIRRGDLRDAATIGPAESFDGAVCNPPYRRPTAGRISANDERKIARHEIHGGLDDFVNAAAYLLRVKGRLAVVYWAERAVDLLSTLRRAGLEPKRLRMVHSFKDSEASLILVEAVKQGRSGVKILPPLIVYREGKQYSDEVAALIAGKSLP
ncbi:MAG: tRNA1(Val) (adenine(37)-N6)-methyltransferase [Deltaproteobacteria bacterium]|nr:tRNA1(Val) (adenine(37)-N6)-methyltransferase [Deltaproteobacteria bacterium]